MAFNPPPFETPNPSSSNVNPVPSPNNHPPPPNLQQELNKSIKTFESNLKIEFRNNNSNLSIRDRLSSLLATLKQGDKHFQIYPTSPTSTLPTLNDPSEVPRTDDILFQYLTPGTIMKNGTKHHLRVSSALRINKLKHIPVVFAHLDNSKIYLTHNNISSTDITSVGWILRVNPDAYSRQELHSHIVTQLREKGYTFSNFQLNSRKISHGRNSPIQTRAWVLELDKEEAKTWLQRLLESFPIGIQKENAIQIVPFSLAAYTTEKSIKKVFLLQNQCLAQSAIIRIDNLRGIQDTTLVNSSGIICGQSIQTLLLEHMSTQPAIEKIPVFHMVTQYNSGRVTCLVKSDFLAEAQKTIDYFLDTYIPSLEPESQARITFPNKPPIRIGRSILPDHIAIVTQAIRSLEVDFNLDDDSFLSAYSTPPPANNFNNNKKRTYASALSNNSTHTTQPNTISPTTASDLTTERSSRIDKLLAQLATKNTTLEASQTTLQTTVTKLQEQFEASLERFDSYASKLEYQQSALISLQSNIAIIMQKLDNLNNRPTASSSSRKHPRPTPTNTEDFVNQNTLNNLSLHTPANTNNMDTDDTPEPDTFYDQADDDPKQDNEQRSR